MIIGCNAANEQGEVKLSIWPYAVVCTDGDQAQSLTSFDASNLGTQTLTATFTPGQGLESLVECEARPTCAKAALFGAPDRGRVPSPTLDTSGGKKKKKTGRCVEA